MIDQTTVAGADGAPAPVVMHPIEPDVKIRELLDLDTMHGIEIGALHNPRLPRGHPAVKYVDHVSDEELREKYKDDPTTGPQVHRAVPVDYVLRRGMRLLDALGEDAPVDFVIASHVIEHIPDPIGWLADIADVLVEGGVLLLVVPDRRFTFDVNRTETTLAELVGAHLDGRRDPTPQQIFDFEVNLTPIFDVVAAWDGEDVTGVVRPDHPDPAAFALERCREQGRGDADTIDVHCTVYTPQSFLDLYADLVRLGLVDLEIVRFYTTEYGHLEFFATLRKISAPSAADRARMIETARSFARQVPWRPTDAGGAPEPEPEAEPDPEVGPEPEIREPWADQPGRVDLNLSPLEARAIAWKRAMTGRLRQAARRVRRLASR